MYGDAHKKLTDSGDWREKIDLATHRYMTEDVAFGLALLVSVGCHAGVHTPVANGLLAIARATFDKDFPYGERSLETLGLAGLSRAAMNGLLTTGTWPARQGGGIE
jgi:opine dehydrogenase